MWYTGLLGRFTHTIGRSEVALPYRVIKRSASNGPDTSPNLIILNPREAGLLKAKPRRPKRRTVQGHQPLQVPPSLTHLDLSGSSYSDESVVSAIHSQRPESAIITRQRYDQIREELARGFKKSHLEDYLNAQKIRPSLFKKLTKPKLAEFIMSGVWNCSVRSEAQQSSGGVFVENILELSEMEFVLVLGRNGRLLREWSKSGARVSISPARNQIIVNSTQETFDWINASLSHFLETMMVTEIDITELKLLVDGARFPEHLATIQQLTDTYFRDAGGNDISADSIAVYSAGDGKYVNTNIVKRLLVQLIQPALSRVWKPDLWWFNTNADSISQSFFHPFDDTDSLEWMERMRDWSRWETVKVKGSRAQEEANKPKCEMSCLSSPEFSALDPEHKTVDDSDASTQLQRIVQKLIESHPKPASINGETAAATLTMTPGYVLHQNDGKAMIPHAGTPKVFTSNIPFISNLASTLPLFSKDVQQEDYPSTEPNEAANLDAPATHSSGGDWFDVLNMHSATDDEGMKVFTARRKDMNLTSNLRLVQMKFVANPHEGLATKYPPLEAWAELPSLSATSNSLLQQVPRLVAVPLEASAHISLPDQKADLKATLAYTYSVDTTPEIESYFLKKCRFGRLGPIEIGPKLNVKFGDQTVSYLYHSAAYVTLTELEFKNHLLQFSQVEGGKLGGRKVEVSLIENGEGASELDAASTSSNIVEKTMAFSKLL